MKTIDTLRDKYDRYIRSGNHVKALQVMREIGQILSHYPRIAETLFPRILADRRRKILKLKSLSKQ